VVAAAFSKPGHLLLSHDHPALGPVRRKAATAGPGTCGQTPHPGPGNAL